MPDLIMRLFSTDGFMPHGMCYLWNPGMIRLQVASDLLIGIAYIAISLTLGTFVRRARHDIPFSWIFIGFGTFILACGGTHFVEVWTLWTPVYWFSGGLKVLTAGASVLVALVLPPLLPKSLALLRLAKSSEERKLELEQANRILEQRVADQNIAQEEIRRLNAQLETLVSSQTSRLSEIRESLALMENTVQHSHDAIWTLDLTARITAWNLAAEQLFGYRAEEVLGHPVSVLAPSDRLNESADLMARLVRGEDVASRETKRVSKSGEFVHVFLTILPVRNSLGEITGASVLASDITAQRRADDMFRLAVQASPSAMIMVDAEGKIAFVNAKTETMFGYSHQELIGREVETLIPARFRGHHEGNRRNFMADPQVRSMGAGRDLSGLRKDGSEFPVEIGLNPIQTDQGMLVLSAIVDITERKRAEEEIHATRRRADDMFRLAVQASPSAMIMVDAAGKIVFVNAQTESLFGYSSTELIGSEIDLLLPARKRGRHGANRREFMAEPRARAMGEGRNLSGLRKDGSEFPVEIGLNPVQMTQETLVLAAIVDITERKRAEEQIQQLNQNLERGVAERTRELSAVNAELESFSYSVAHDLRAPVRQIAGFSKILFEECGQDLDDQGKKYLRRVQDGASHMGNLVDDLLNLAHVSRQTVSRRPTPLNSSVQTVLGQLDSECAGRRIEWHIEELGSAQCDAALIQQVFANLLSNAVKFTRGRDPAVIHVGTTTVDGERVIFVRDNGAGFDMAYAGKLFGVFQRLHSPQEFEGTGIGLANVQKIVRKHSGRIWAEAEPDKGAAFFFTIPD